jgi:hypothetical protein
LLINTFQELNADVIGVQEVSFLKQNQLNDLYRENEYTQFLAEAQLIMREVNYTPDDEFNIDGLAILGSKKVMEHSTNTNHKVLHISAIRPAQMLKFSYNDITVIKTFTVD